MKKNKRNYPRILIGYSEIAGYHSNLKKGFLELGLKCVFINGSSDKYGYGGDDHNWIIDSWKYFGNKRRVASNNIALKAFWYGLHKLSTLALLIWTFFCFDVYVIGFAGTLFGFKELPIMKLLNKKIIYLFHGTDSRPPYLNGVYRGSSTKDLIDASIFVKKRLEKIEKYADHIISNPPQCHFHEKSIINRMYVGSPIVCEASGAKLSSRNKIFTIVHSPSNPEAKGTREIRKIIDKLKLRGYKIKYRELVGVPNSKVLELISSCDIVIDQLYSDFFLTSISIEASYFGKPTLVGGYYADYIHSDYKGEIPVIFFNPDHLEKTIIKMIEDQDYRVGVGEAARNYVLEHGSPKKVAQNYLRIISNDIPTSWIYDPKEITYPYGCGLSKGEAINNVREMVNSSGFESLLLSGKNNIKKIFSDILNI